METQTKTVFELAEESLLSVTTFDRTEYFERYSYLGYHVGADQAWQVPYHSHALIRNRIYDYRRHFNCAFGPDFYTAHLFYFQITGPRENSRGAYQIFFDIPPQEYITDEAIGKAMVCLKSAVRWLNKECNTGGSRLPIIFRTWGVKYFKQETCVLEEVIDGYRNLRNVLREEYKDNPSAPFHAKFDKTSRNFVLPAAV